MKMTKVVNDLNVALGSTPAGQAWCMKALNPAYPGTIDGIPDSSNAPRVVQHFERTFTCSFAAAAANWSLDVVMHPNPWIPCCSLTNDGVTATFTTQENSQLGGGEDVVRDYLRTHVEAYRVIYGSCTAVLDATSVTNSGLVAATQYIWTPNTFGGVVNAATRNVVRLVRAWPDAPKSYDSLIQMPGSYVGAAKDGVYVPLRIDAVPMWVRTNELYQHVNTADANVMTLGTTMVSASFVAAGASNPDWPYGIRSSTQAAYAFELANSQDTCAHFAMRNLHPDATVRVTYRLGVEFLVPPNTIYSPNLRVPPMYDQVALDAYKIISSKLRMAYPADYNDWQKIVRTISDIAQTVLPMLPGGQVLSPMIPLVERGVVSIGNRIAGAVARRRAARAADARAAKNILRVQVPPAPVVSQFKKKQKRKMRRIRLRSR